MPRKRKVRRYQKVYAATPLRLAVRIVGGPRVMASWVGVTRRCVHQWLELGYVNKRSTAEKIALIPDVQRLNLHVRELLGLYGDDAVE